MNDLVTKSGAPLHPIGIGTWNIASRRNTNNLSGKYGGVEPAYGDEDAEIKALRYSLGRGQNHLDCAELYGGFYTDEVVGRAIAGLSRADMFIADKLWKTSLDKGNVRPTVEQMLKKLGTDYLDLLYIHSPFADAPWQEAIPQIDELIDAGIVRYFGVSNFTVKQMEEAMALAKHALTANQMNYNVLYRDEVDEAFHAFCRQHGIKIVAYQPIKRQEVLANQTVRAVADAHHATPAQVALAWLLAMDTLPIPKAVQTSHIDENLGALDLHLSEQEIVELGRL